MNFGIEIEITSVIIRLVIKLIDMLFPRYLTRNIKDYQGFFIASWNKYKTQQQKDFIKLFRFKNAVYGKTIFTIDPNTNYTIVGSIKEKYLLLGNWQNLLHEYKFGAIHVKPKGQNGILNDGVWTGSTRDAHGNTQIYSGNFQLESRIAKSSYPFHETKLNKVQFKKNVRTIVKNHNSLLQKEVELKMPNGIKIPCSVTKGVFNPEFGNFSYKLLKYADIYNPKSVLDIGTGCGYYSLYFYLFKGSDVIATDIDRNAIVCTKHNFELHKCNITTLSGYLYEELYKEHKTSKKFDLIIANIPFSKKSYISKAITNIDFDSKSLRKSFIDIFASTRETSIRDLILGAEYFLNPNGHLIFVYGGSGYHKEFKEALYLTSLDLINTTNIDTEKIASESLAIYDFKLNMNK
jgi:tRNA1(Val) A37 N6-methylase TrmN6